MADYSQLLGKAVVPLITSTLWQTTLHGKLPGMEFLCLGLVTSAKQQVCCSLRPPCPGDLNHRTEVPSKTLFTMSGFGHPKELCFHLFFSIFRNGRKKLC